MAGAYATAFCLKTAWRRPILLELETRDPDDFLALLWLSDHPCVDLVGVLITPGSEDQCRLVRWALDHVGKHDVPIGVLHGTAWWQTADGQRPRVAPFHYTVYGASAREHAPGDVEPGAALVARLLASHPDATYLAGAPPKTLGAAFAAHPDLRLARWVQQGGFAGDNLVAPEHRLEKFSHLVSYESYNLNGARKQALALLGEARIARRLLVSKNVCHSVVWTPATHACFERRLLARWFVPTADEVLLGRPAPPPPADWRSGLRPGLRTMLHGLQRYLYDRGVGRSMHDVVAAACALDKSVCTFTEVEVFCHSGKWGAERKPGTGTFITVAHDAEKLLDVLATTGPPDESVVKRLHSNE